MPGTKWGQRWGDPWGRSELRVTQLAAARRAGDELAVELDWSSALAAQGVWHQVYRDGRRLATTRATHLATAGLPGAEHLFEVLDVGPRSGEPRYDLAWACAAIPGRRVRLAWDRVADAAAYAVYWDAGGGEVGFAAPWVVRRETGEARQGWTTPELADGTYRFVVRARDAAGNESANATPLLATVSGWPRAPAGLAASYSDPNLLYPNPDPEGEPLPGTGQVTLTWRDPPGLPEGSKLRVYGGELALSGEWDAALGDWPEVAYATPLAEVEPGVGEWTSAALDPGRSYAFALRAFDGEIEELNTDCRVRLELDAAGTATTARPAAPVGVSAMPVAGGKVRLVGFIPRRLGDLSPAGARLFHAADPETLLAGEGEAATVEIFERPGGWGFVWESPALAEGVARYFLCRATALDADPWAPYSPVAAADVVSATPDATAPEAPANPGASVVQGED